MVELFQNAGAMGIAILICAASLGALTTHAYLSAKDRSIFVLLFMLSTIPVGLGFAGYKIGMHNLEVVVGLTPGQASPLEIQRGVEIARAPLTMGAGTSIAFGVLALCRLLLKRDDREGLI
ncbi:MAG: hypothetical protein ACI841_000412 [Planctomycetota bacterium]|jgi:hypothetical protein